MGLYRPRGSTERHRRHARAPSSFPAPTALMMPARAILFSTFSPRAPAINLPDKGGFATFVNTDLTLVPCIQDLRQDRVPTCTKAKFDIWNENETKYTGAYQCLKCWFEGYLGDIGSYTIGYGGEKFWYKNLHTTAGRFRVEGIPSYGVQVRCSGLPVRQMSCGCRGSQSSAWSDQHGNQVYFRSV